MRVYLEKVNGAVVLSVLLLAASHVLLVGFVDGDVVGCWKRAARSFDDRAVGFASPFLRTVPGTDTYTDDL